MNLIDGKIVWDTKGTHGLPLDMALQILAAKKLVPTWDRLFLAAKKDGANLAKLARELSFFVKEAYGAEFAAQFERRVPLLLTTLQ